MRVWFVGMLALACAVAGCAEQTPTTETPGPAVPEEAEPPRADLRDKRVVMLIGHENFRDEELQIPKDMLEDAGAEVLVASSSMDPSKGMMGAVVRPDMMVEDIELAELDALVLVGGTGAKEYWDDPQVHELARKVREQDKVLAAICLAPVTLANAGLLDGCVATVWRTEAARLRAQGAEYTGERVESSQGIITASGPEAANEFGRAIIQALSR